MILPQHLHRALAHCLLLPGLLLLSSYPVRAQDPCDSLEILHVRYHPFFDTVVNVTTDGTGTQFFSGPQFNLIDEQGDTIARQPFEFFGIGGGIQTNHLQLLPGEQLPSSPFSGSLVLYAWIDGPDTCTWAVGTDLCPPDSCIPLNVYLYSQAPGGQPFTTSFTWQVHDSLHTTVASGILEINVFGQQQDIADLCLPPGHYELHLQQAEDIGVEYAVGVSQGGDPFIDSGPSTTLQPGGQVMLPFDYYAPCISGSNGIGEAVPIAPVLIVDGHTVHLNSAKGSALGSIAVLDATGQLVRSIDARSSTASVDLSGLAAGVYLLRPTNASWPAQRFVLH